VTELEALKTIAGLSLASNDIENGVDQFSTLGVVAFCPVVPSSSLSEDKVVGSEELSIRTGTDAIHGAGLEIEQNGSGNISSTGCFIEINIYPFQLLIAVSTICPSGIDSVFV
jgi:hypothetical protein